MPFSHELCVAISRPITCGLTGFFTAHQGFSLGALDWVRVQLITLVNGALCSIEKPFAGTLSCRSGQVFQIVFAVRACRFGTRDRTIAAIRGWKVTISRRICLQDLLMGIRYHNHTIHVQTQATGTAKRLKQDMANAKAGFLRRRELEREREECQTGRIASRPTLTRASPTRPDCLREGREKTGAGLDG